MTPKRPFIDSKRTLLLKNRHIFIPNRDSRESRLAYENNPFFTFLWSRKWPPLGFVGLLFKRIQIFPTQISQTLLIVINVSVTILKIKTESASDT